MCVWHSNPQKSLPNADIGGIYTPNAHGNRIQEKNAILGQVQENTGVFSCICPCFLAIFQLSVSFGTGRKTRALHKNTGVFLCILVNFQFSSTFSFLHAFYHHLSS